MIVARTIRVSDVTQIALRRTLLVRGVILAGGTGSRLFPLTKVTNKHLLPIGRYPMIYHAIFRMVQSGIRDVLVVTGREHMGDVVNLLGSGHEFGVRFTYKVQEQAGLSLIHI